MTQVFTALGFFLVFAIGFQIIINKKNKKYEKEAGQFFEKDRNANNIRKRPIDENYYYVPDMNKFPVKEYENTETNAEIVKKQDYVIRRSGAKMIKFKVPKSNLEIKTEFGISNLEIIAGYEENFSNFMAGLNNWANELIKIENYADAEIILRKAIDDGSDLSKTFILLADIYYNNKDMAKLQQLYEFISTKDFSWQGKVLDYIKKISY